MAGSRRSKSQRDVGALPRAKYAQSFTAKDLFLNYLRARACTVSAGRILVFAVKGGPFRDCALAAGAMVWYLGWFFPWDRLLCGDFPLDRVTGTHGTNSSGLLRPFSAFDRWLWRRRFYDRESRPRRRLGRPATRASHFRHCPFERHCGKSRHAACCLRVHICERRRGQLE